MENKKEKKIWFKRKRYGWGWAPASVQGWVVIFAYIVALIANFKTIDVTQHSGSDTLLSFAPRFVLLTIALIIICYAKGEKPKWSWGDDTTSLKK